MYTIQTQGERLFITDNMGQMISVELARAFHSASLAMITSETPETIRAYNREYLLKNFPSMADQVYPVNNQKKVRR